MVDRRDTSEEQAIEYDGPIETMPRDVELEAPFAADEVTPLVRVCPDCGADQVDAGDGTRLPEDVGEASALVRCWGATDAEGPRWCRSMFTATVPREGKRISFDRRLARKDRP